MVTDLDNLDIGIGLNKEVWETLAVVDNWEFVQLWAGLEKEQLNFEITCIRQNKARPTREIVEIQKAIHRIIQDLEIDEIEVEGNLEQDDELKISFLKKGFS